MPSILSSLSKGSQVSAIFFQSKKDIFSDHFMNGFSIFILQIFFISGAMFKISSESVEITPPDFGSSLEDIVPPVIINAIVGRDLFCFNSIFAFSSGFAFSVIVASKISFSLIPML